MSLAQIHTNLAALAPAKRGQAVAWLALFRLATMGPLTFSELSLALYGEYTNATKVRLSNSVLSRLVGRKVVVQDVPEGQRKHSVRDTAGALVDVLETGKGKRVYAINARGAKFVEQQVALRNAVEVAAGARLSHNAWNAKARDLTTLTKNSAEGHTVLARGFLALRAAQAAGLLSVIGEPALRRGMCPAISLESMKSPARVPDGAIFNRDAAGTETLEIVEAEFTKKGHADAVKAFDKFSFGLDNSYWVAGRPVQTLLTYVVPAARAEDFKRNIAAAFGRWVNPKTTPLLQRDSQGQIIPGSFVPVVDEDGLVVAGEFEEDTAPAAALANGLTTRIRVRRDELALVVPQLTRAIRFVPASITPQGCVACDFDYETLEQYLARTGETLENLAADTLAQVPLMRERARQSLAPRRQVAAEKKAKAEAELAALAGADLPEAIGQVPGVPFVEAAEVIEVVAPDVAQVEMDAEVVSAQPAAQGIEVAPKASPVPPEWGRFSSKDLTKLARHWSAEEALAQVCEAVQLVLDQGGACACVPDVAASLYAALKLEAKDDKQQGQFLFQLSVYATEALTALAAVGRAQVAATKTLANGREVPTSFNLSTY